MSDSRPPPSISINYDELRYLPMLVGVISPVSIIMSLPPLTGSWVSIDGKPSEVIKSLPIFVVLSFAVFSLLVANICLLFRFMERRIVLNTAISIAAYLVHAILMFGPLLHFYVTNEPGPSEKITGDFYAGVGVSALSVGSAFLLIIDYFRHDRLRLKGSGISSKQRNLVFFCIVVTLWASFGALIFSYVEEWSFTRGVYFTLVTMTTIGFGDYYPENISTRVFLFPYAIIGIVAMGILINSIRIVMIERFESIYLKKMDELGLIELERYFTLAKKATTFANPKGPTSEPAPIPEKILTRRERTNIERGKLLLRQLHFSIFSLLLFWALGAVIFMLIEKWSYFDAFYFCFVSFTTVGYGDVTLKTFNGIVVFIAYALLGLVAAAYVISVATELWSVTLEQRANKIDKKHRRKAGENQLDSSEQTSEMLLSTLDTIDQKSGNKELDLLCQFVGITRLYHSQVGYHLEDCEENFPADLLDSPRFKKVERYHTMVSKLLEKSQNIIATQLKNNRSSQSHPDLISETSTEIYHQGAISEQIELLERRNTESP